MKKLMLLVMSAFMLVSLNVRKINAASNHLYSKYVYVTDVNGNEVFAKNEDEEMYPASITKLLFCLVAYDKMSENHNLSDYAGKIKKWDISHARKQGLYCSGLKNKEKVTYNDLFHSILFKSGAEAAYALMRFTFGKEGKAVSAMNNKCEELGMDDSNFTNITGKHNDDQYTTPKDFNKVVKLAWNTDAIRKIMLQGAYWTKDHKHKFLAPRLYYKKYCDSNLLGGKTGTTSKAQHTFAGFIKAKGQVLLTVTGKSSIKVRESHIRDERTLAKIINANYHLISITPYVSPKYTNLSATDLLWHNGEEPTVSGVVDDDNANVTLDLSSAHQEVELTAIDTEYNPEVVIE